MLNRLKIPVRLLLLGGIPLVGLLLVLLVSFRVSETKDGLFDRLYEDHLMVLGDILVVQRLVQQNALNEIRLYRSGWAGQENTVTAVNSLLDEAAQRWQVYQQARTDSESELNQKADEQFDRAGVFQDSCHYFCLKQPVLSRSLFPGSALQGQPAGSF